MGDDLRQESVVEIARFLSEMEALLAADHLCAHGIEAHMHAYSLNVARLGVPLFVMAEREEEARAILEDVKHQSEGDESLPPSDRMVVLARYPKVMEAELAARTLKAHGISAEVEPHAAYETLSHIQIGLNAQGVAVLVPEHQANEARTILAGIRGEESDDNQAATGLERRCGRAFFLAVVALFVLGPLGIASLLYTLAARRALRAGADQLSERRVTRCEVNLSFAIMVAAVAPVFGSIIWGLVYFFAMV